LLALLLTMLLLCLLLALLLHMFLTFLAEADYNDYEDLGLWVHQANVSYCVGADDISWESARNGTLLKSLSLRHTRRCELAAFRPLDNMASIAVAETLHQVSSTASASLFFSNIPHSLFVAIPLIVGASARHPGHLPRGWLLRARALGARARCDAAPHAPSVHEVRRPQA
jgi:hypothetical protein